MFICAGTHTPTCSEHAVCVFLRQNSCFLLAVSHKIIIWVLLWMFNYIRVSDGAFSPFGRFLRALAKERRSAISSKMLMFWGLFFRYVIKAFFSKTKM